MKFLSILVTILLTTIAWAEAPTLQIHEIESSFEQRIRSMVKPIDPQVQVFVDIELEKEKEVGYLPGTASELGDFSDLLAENGILGKTVSKIEVKIYSKLEKFPDWLVDEVKQSFKLKKGKIDIIAKQLDPDSIKIMEDQKINPNIDSAVEKIFSKIESLWQGNSQFLFTLLGGLIGFIFIFSFWLSTRGQKNLKNELKALAKVISETNQDNQLSSFIDVEGRTQEAQQALTPGTSEKLELSFEQVLALFSDAYWCQQDAYGAYIWKNISNNLREQLLSSWDPTAEYVSSLANVIPQNLGLDDHPAYLDPVALYNVSQTDLAEWLSENPEGWGHLSPLRQQYLSLSIEDRVRYMAQNVSDKFSIKTPSIKSVPRNIELKNQAFSLSLEDDEKLFDNPNIIPVEDRHKFPTLVWLALCEKQSIEQAMSGLTAREIASAWVGPKKVLNRLAAAIPEKKRNLVFEYSQKIQKSRNSNVFIHLFEQGLENINEDAA